MSEKTGHTTDKKRCGAHKTADIFMTQFNKESDRAAVIVGATIIETSLEVALKYFLVRLEKVKNDPLFDGPNAPLSSFNAKIEMAFRSAIISDRLRKALHIIRKIRNRFAHDILDCDFNNTQVISLVQELEKTVFAQMKRSVDEKKVFSGARGDFQISLLRILWWFWCADFKRSLVPLTKRDFELLSVKKNEWSAPDIGQG